MAEDVRNSLFWAKKHLIGATMKKHSRLIQSARLDGDDVRQELAVRLIEAIAGYDPALCKNMDAYLMLQLRYRLYQLREGSALYGVPQAPRKAFTVLSLNDPDHAGLEAQAVTYNTQSNVQRMETEIVGLPEPQRDAIERLLAGGRVNSRNKSLQEVRKSLRKCLALLLRFLFTQ